MLSFFSLYFQHFLYFPTIFTLISFSSEPILFQEL